MVSALTLLMKYAEMKYVKSSLWFYFFKVQKFQIFRDPRAHSTSSHQCLVLFILTGSREKQA